MFCMYGNQLYGTESNVGGKEEVATCLLVYQPMSHDPLPHLLLVALG